MAEEPKFRKIFEGANHLSLGISIVAAILLGVGAGFLMRDLFDVEWLLWVGVFWGAGAAILNVYKAYEKQKKEYDTLAEDPRYSYTNQKLQEKDGVD